MLKSNEIDSGHKHVVAAVGIALIGSVATFLGVEYVTASATPAKPANATRILDWKEVRVSPQVERVYELVLQETWLQGSERFRIDAFQSFVDQPSPY